MFEKIISHYKDELGDVVSYSDMANAAETETQRCILRDIAREEHQHAAMLRHILEKAGRYSPAEDVKRLENDAEAALRKF